MKKGCLVYIIPTTSRDFTKSQKEDSNKNFSSIRTTSCCFKNKLPTAQKIEKEFLAQGFDYQFAENDFVAHCVKKIALLFKELFGKEALPQKFRFESIKEGFPGGFYRAENLIRINSDCDYFNNLQPLTSKMKQGHELFSYKPKATAHPANTYVHEFAHAAHWSYLTKRHGYFTNSTIWQYLRNAKLPPSISKFITQLKLGDYAANGVENQGSLCEFMAERITKDICDCINPITWDKEKEIDVDYANIFENKWENQYTSPQSCIDYLTQQIWNGDVEGNLYDESEPLYLKEIINKRPCRFLFFPRSDIIISTDPFRPIEKLFGMINEQLTNLLDKDNKIRLR